MDAPIVSLFISAFLWRNAFTDLLKKAFMSISFLHPFRIIQKNNNDDNDDDEDDDDDDNEDDSVFVL